MMTERCWVVWFVFVVIAHDDREVLGGVVCVCSDST